MKDVNGTAEAGDWGYEALGALHTHTSVDGDTEMLFIG
ncbi:cupin domain-containing protein [Emcibacter nanhaiensis]